MANHNLGTIRGTIEIDYDGAGVVRAIRDTEKMKGRSAELEKSSDGILKAFGKSAKGAIIFAGALNFVQNAAGLVANTIAIIAPIAAAAFAVAPGIALAFAAALTIVKIALSGVGDALKAAGEGGDKFDAALKKLSPNAAKFVQAYAKAIPVLNAVKKSIQDAFFQGAAKGVAGIVTRVASLRAQASGVAFAIGQIAQNIVRFATSGRSIEHVRAILSGLNAFLLQIRGSLGPVVQGFIRLAAQVSSFGASLGGTVNGALAKLASWLNSIDIAALFQRALPIIQSLGDVIGNVSDIFTTLFSGLTSNGTNAASVLAIITGQLASFLHTAEGQSALAALGAAMATIGGAAGQVFLALLQAIAPVLVALAPGLASLAVSISGVLIPALSTLSPILTAVAGFLTGNMDAIAPLLAAILALAAAYKVYSVVVGAVTAINTLANSSMITSTIAWIANTAAVIANKAAWLAGAIAMGVVRGATIAWTAIQWLLNAALTANPIGIVIVAIGALVAAIIWVATKTQFFQTVWGGIWAFLKVVGAWFAGPFANFFVSAWNVIVAGAQALWGKIVAIWNGIRAGITTAINIIRTVVTTVWAAIVAATSAYINAVRSVIQVGINFVKRVWTDGLNGIRIIATAVWSGIVAAIRGYIAAIRGVISGISAVVGIVRNAFNSARSAVSSALGSIISLVRSLPGRVAGALGGLGGLLYSKGKELIQGFINGIGAMIGAVKAKVHSVVSAVTGFLPGSPAKEGPLSGRGYVLLRARRFMDDFAQGLQDGAQKPSNAMLGAVVPMGRAVAPAGSGTRSGPSVAPVLSGATGTTRPYVLIVGGKQMAEFVVDSVTGAPVAVSKAVDEGSRRTAWAGSGR